MSNQFKIAGVQMDVSLGNQQENLSRMQAYLEEATRSGAVLTVFPECALTGYCFDSLEDALPYGETIPGPSTAAMADTCRQLDTYAVLGMLEVDDGRLFNAAVMIGPAGMVGSYRKIHLPHLGIDRFTTPGDRPFAVHHAGDLRVAMNICYDSAFPESSRVMALAGADLIVLPTNFPPGASCMLEHVVHARAMENAVYYAAVNRVGTEAGFHFIGQSKICGPDGETLAEAGADEETILLAEIDPEKARNKLRVRVPGKHQIHRFDDRRPEMYGSLVEPRQQA